MKAVIIGFILGVLLFNAYKWYAGGGAERFHSHSQTERCSGNMVVTTSTTNVYRSMSRRNCETVTAVSTVSREVYVPVMVKAHWVTDGEGNRIRYVEEHVEYR